MTSKFLKTVYCFLCVLLIFVLNGFDSIAMAQTKIIGHKSHGGKAKTYQAKQLPEFFGEGPCHGEGTIVKVTKISVVVEKRTHPCFGIVLDTFAEHPLYFNSNISLDSLKKHFHKRVVFDGFDKEKQSLQKKNVKKRSFNKPKKKEIQVPLEQEKSIDEEDKGSIILWLFIIFLTLNFALTLFHNKKDIVKPYNA